MRLSSRLVGLVAPLVALAAWALVAETGLVHHRALAGPRATARALVDGMRGGGLVADLGATLGRSVVALAIGVVAGVAVGLWVGIPGTRARATEPFLDFLRAVPPLLLLPVFLLTLGYGDAARISVAAWAATLVVSLHVAAGARRTHPERERVLCAMGASRWQQLVWLRFWEALPSTLTAIRQALATVLVVTVVTEMVAGAQSGLGSRALAAQIAYDAPGLYSVILLTGAVGFAGAELLLALERRVAWWQAPS